MLLMPGEERVVRTRNDIIELCVEVPDRNEGRTSAHREQFCLAQLLLWLLENKPSTFPVSVTRSESPDFILATGASRTRIGVEHTDCGTRDFQKWLGRDRSRGEDKEWVELLPLEDGYAGDQPKRMLETDILEAIQRKCRDQVWAGVLHTDQRWLMIYDNSEAGDFISDSTSADCLLRAYGLSAPQRSSLTAIFLLRGGGRVLGPVPIE